MRVSSESSNLCGSHFEGTSESASVSACRSWVTKSLSRSDVSRTVPDADGWRPPTPYYVQEQTTMPYTGVMGYKRTDKLSNGTTQVTQWKTSECLEAVGFGNRWVAPLPAVPSAVTFPSDLAGKANTKALGKLKDNNVNLAVALAESARTAGLVTEKLTKLRKAYVATRKGDLKGALRALEYTEAQFYGRWRRGSGHKAVARRWLELQYGWLPLMTDVYGVYSEFTKGQPIRVTTSGAASSSSRSSVTSNNGDIYKQSVLYEHQFGVYCRYDYTVDNEAVANYARDLGVTNPALVVWELVPFSFVVDWFASIGDWLSAMDADFGLAFRAGSVTSRYVRSTVGALGFRSRQTNTSTSTFQYTEACSAVNSVKTVTRTVITQPPSGSLYFKNPISWRHAASAASLLTTKMRFK